MTDNTQELDEILDEFLTDIYMNNEHFAANQEALDKTKEEPMRAILAWHNKQVEEVIKKPHILPKNAQHQESVKQGINFYHRQMRKRVDKLKESSND